MNSGNLPAVLATMVLLASATPVLAVEGEEAQSQQSGSVVEGPVPTAPKKAEKKSEWQVKPRWRVQYDVAEIDGPAGLPGTGSYDDLRRARIGVDIKAPNGFLARVEGEFSTDPIEFTDAYVGWSGNGISIVAGQQKNFTPLDDMTSNLNTSFIERAAFSTTFGYGRRTGISAVYSKADWAIGGGVFTDPFILINDVKSNSLSADFRGYWEPKVGKAALHFGAAYHIRELNDFANITTRYRQRPLVRITDTRYIGTPALNVDREQRYGLEAAAVSGRFHGAAEVHWLNASRVGLSDPTLFGGYAEAGVFLTKDTRPLKAGVFGAIKPHKPLGSGGIGAVQVNVRYDYLDLNSAGVTGGKQDGYLASLIWTPVDFVRLMANYARLDYTDAIIAVAGRRDYSVDVMAVRFQLNY